MFNDLLVFAVKDGVKQTAVELALENRNVWVEDLNELDPQTSTLSCWLFFSIQISGILKLCFQKTHIPLAMRALHSLYFFTLQTSGITLFKGTFYYIFIINAYMIFHSSKIVKRKIIFFKIKIISLKSSLKTD